ncbi:hypothetical protein LX64_03429 [Chitinophaga skermanii]|uniref:Pirin family protein n=1 Tax=Chitinophaga skermanii TaxID=331697 RepID=A0A327QCQ1_9BACT|nr:pirin family protein [Chitinophaga skermanii]RAJ02416.1 hypothetical protein LX64_03429 [Chitinophaga skermanii]
MRTIKQIHAAIAAPIADLVTYRAIPTHTVQYIDPFLFLNHHGPQHFPARNNGLPFGPHPHRGMETVTFIIDGDIVHQDSSGYESVIEAGGVQWMTAGKGLIHAETSSAQFKENGGQLEILQLWLNLPAKLKMTAPLYKGLQRDEIHHEQLDEGRVTVDLIAGDWNGQAGAFHAHVQLNVFHFDAGGKVSLHAPKEHNVFFYVIRGELLVNHQEVKALHLVEFNNDGETIHVHAEAPSILLYGQAKPFNEPIVAHGPFVMNTEEEIAQAYEDYRRGDFGNWDF